MTIGVAQAPEFSRIVEVSGLGRQESVHEIAATAAERDALARRFDLSAFERLEATVRLRRRAGAVVELRGRFSAAVEQACVVTLEPVPATIEREFQQVYAADAAPDDGEVVVHAEEEEDAPEALNGERIDIGEAVVQQLAVALDPYPRKPGAELPQAYAEAGAEEPRQTPFAVLSDLRRS